MKAAVPELSKSRFSYRSLRSAPLIVVRPSFSTRSSAIAANSCQPNRLLGSPSSGNTGWVLKSFAMKSRTGPWIAFRVSAALRGSPFCRRRKSSAISSSVALSMILTVIEAKARRSCATCESSLAVFPPRSPRSSKFDDLASANLSLKKFQMAVSRCLPSTTSKRYRCPSDSWLR